MIRNDLPATLAVVGLGHVGLPLACSFGRVLPTVGFDVDKVRVQELRNGCDQHGEVDPEALKASNLQFTDDPALLGKVSFTVVAVPTPIDRYRRPDLSYLVEASRLVGLGIKAFHAQRPGKVPIVVYEGTVYPGCTEEVCIPVLEAESGLKAGSDFKVGYSPERVSPGEPEHTVEKVVKIVAGQDQATTEAVAAVYGLIVKAGLYRAPDIRTAEAAKLVENIQRDVNIALMNELALLFHRLGLNTREVLKASRTKWNFLPFEPGLVGGECIPVNPYYLFHKAEEVGFASELMRSGRRVNESMASFVARETVRLLARAGRVNGRAKVLVFGAAFKENVGDLRGTRVVELVRELERFNVDVSVYEPLANAGDLRRQGLRSVSNPFHAAHVPSERYDGLVLAVPHKLFRDTPPQAYLQLLRTEDGPGVLVDIRSVLAEVACDENVLYWAL